MIAPTAKFRVENLPLTTALEVGMVTFRYVGFFELLLSVFLCFLLIWRRPKNFLVGFLPVAIFSIQWILLMPILDRRTMALISGIQSEPSSIHLVYICLEIVKVALFLGIGIVGFAKEN